MLCPDAIIRRGKAPCVSIAGFLAYSHSLDGSRKLGGLRKLLHPDCKGHPSMHQAGKSSAYHSQNGLPEIVFSTGDPNGIGPEITLKSLSLLHGKTHFRPILAGNEHYLRELDRELGTNLPWQEMEIINVGGTQFAPSWGKVAEDSGRIAFDALNQAVETCRDRGLPLLVTAPVNKMALRLAGFSFPGQTEYLASSFGDRRVCMAFLSNTFHLLLATIHIPLSRVPASLNSSGLYQDCCLFQEALKRICAEPRIAVSGLNPHASENSLFGEEEEQIILPTVLALQEQFGKETFSGPYPPDTVFNKAASGAFEGVVAMYHDQGLIPLKMLSFDQAVMRREQAGGNAGKREVPACACSPSRTR